MVFTNIITCFLIFVRMQMQISLLSRCNSSYWAKLRRVNHDSNNNSSIKSFRVFAKTWNTTTIKYSSIALSYWKFLIGCLLKRYSYQTYEIAVLSNLYYAYDLIVRRACAPALLCECNAVVIIWKCCRSPALASSQLSVPFTSAWVLY